MMKNKRISFNIFFIVWLIFCGFIFKQKSWHIVRTVNCEGRAGLNINAGVLMGLVIIMIICFIFSVMMNNRKQGD